MPTVQGVWVSHVPTQDSSPVLHIPKGRISCIQEPRCSWQLTNLSLVPGSSTDSLQQEMAPTLPVLPAVPNSGCLAQPHPAAEGSTTGKSSCTWQHPVLPTGSSHFLFLLQLQSTAAANRTWTRQHLRNHLQFISSPFFCLFGLLGATKSPHHHLQTPSIHPSIPDLSLQPCLLFLLSPSRLTPPLPCKSLKQDFPSIFPFPQPYFSSMRYPLHCFSHPQSPGCPRCC